MAGLLIFLIPSRRFYLLRTLTTVYPEMDLAQKKRFGRASAAHMVEMGLFVLASPFLSERRIEAAIEIGKSSLGTLDDLRKSDNPSLLLTPHFCTTEIMAMSLPKLGLGKGRAKSLYRPFENRGLDQFIRKSRARMGLDLLSRKDGFSAAIHHLKSENGWLVMLFDQHAGDGGSLILFLNQLASATNLPDLLVRKTHPNLVFAWMERVGFWKGELHFEMLRAEEYGKSGGSPTLLAHQRLENLLWHQRKVAPTWLWLHRRWKVQTRPHRRFRIEQKRSLLDAALSQKGLSELPRSTRVLLYFPEDPRLAETLIPMIQVLRRSRPDFHLTLIATGKLLAEVPSLKGIPDALKVLPENRGIGRLRFWWALRRTYPHVAIVLERDKLAPTFGAFLSGASQRFGERRRGQWRPFLNCVRILPSAKDSLESGEDPGDFFKFFGMPDSGLGSRRKRVQ